MVNFLGVLLILLVFLVMVICVTFIGVFVIQFRLLSSELYSRYGDTKARKDDELIKKIFYIFMIIIMLVVILTYSFISIETADRIFDDRPSEEEFVELSEHVEVVLGALDDGKFDENEINSINYVDDSKLISGIDLGNVMTRVLEDRESKIARRMYDEELSKLVTKLGYVSVRGEK